MIFRNSEFFSLLLHVWSQYNIKIVLGTQEQHLQSIISLMAKIQNKSAEMAQKRIFAVFRAFYFLKYQSQKDDIFQVKTATAMILEKRKVNISK